MYGHVKAQGRKLLGMQCNVAAHAHARNKEEKKKKWERMNESQGFQQNQLRSTVEKKRRERESYVPFCIFSTKKEVIYRKYVIFEMKFQESLRTTLSYKISVTFYLRRYYLLTFLLLSLRDKLTRKVLVFERISKHSYIIIR